MTLHPNILLAIYCSLEGYFTWIYYVSCCFDYIHNNISTFIYSFHGKDISYYAVAGSLTFIHESYNFQLAIAYIIIM